MQTRMSASANLQEALVNKQKFSTFTNKEGMTLKLHFGALHHVNVQAMVKVC